MTRDSPALRQAAPARPWGKTQRLLSGLGSSPASRRAAAAAAARPRRSGEVNVLGRHCGALAPGRRAPALAPRRAREERGGRLISHGQARAPLSRPPGGTRGWSPRGLGTCGARAACMAPEWDARAGVGRPGGPVAACLPTSQALCGRLWLCLGAPAAPAARCGGWLAPAGLDVVGVEAGWGCGRAEARTLAQAGGVGSQRAPRVYLAGSGRRAIGARAALRWRAPWRGTLCVRLFWL